MVAEVEPPLLFAQMVYVVAVVSNTVGIPQIVPLLVPKLRPVGRLPLISHEVMTPEPVSVAFSGKSMLANPLISVRFSGEYERAGTTSLMVMLMLVVELPLALLAVILYCVGFIKTVGVPQIVPLLVPKLRPDGSDCEIDQLLGWPMTVPDGLFILSSNTGVIVYDDPLDIV